MHLWYKTSLINVLSDMELTVGTENATKSSPLSQIPAWLDTSSALVLGVARMALTSVLVQPLSPW